MADKKIVNGVDVQAVMDTVKAIEGKAEIADFTFRLKNEWVDGGQNRGTAGPFHGALHENDHMEKFVMTADEPGILAGTDKGPNAVEYLLQALAACVTGTLVYHSAVRGIEIRAMESEIEGNIDLRGFLGISDEVKKGCKKMSVKFRVDTDEKNLATLRELVNLSPVYDTLKNYTEVDVSIERMSEAKSKAA